VAAAARRGNADAKTVLAWMANFLVGRFHAERHGFLRRDGVAYLLAITPERAGQTAAPFRTWREIGEATQSRNLSNGTGWRSSQGYYGRLGLVSLALVMDLTGREDAAAAHAWLLEAAPPGTDIGQMARDPVFSIVPRGRPRVPGRAPRCT
jgi:hypothetical protein